MFTLFYRKKKRLIIIVQSRCQPKNKKKRKLKYQHHIDEHDMNKAHQIANNSSINKTQHTHRLRFNHFKPINVVILIKMESIQTRFSQLKLTSRTNDWNCVCNGYKPEITFATIFWVDCNYCVFAIVCVCACVFGCICVFKTKINE